MGGGYNYYYNTDGGLLANRPTVCGGYCSSSNCGSSLSGAQDNCHYYNETANDWYLLAKMTTNRYQHAILMITPDLMWITGIFIFLYKLTNATNY